MLCSLSVCHCRIICIPSRRGLAEKLRCPFFSPPVLKTTRSWTEALNTAAALSTCSCGLGDFFFPPPLIVPPVYYADAWIARCSQLYRTSCTLLPFVLRQLPWEKEGWRVRGGDEAEKSVRMLCGFMSEETHYAHFQVHDFILGCNQNRYTCCNAQKSHQFSHIVLCNSMSFSSVWNALF